MNLRVPVAGAKTFAVAPATKDAHDSALVDTSAVQDVAAYGANWGNRFVTQKFITAAARYNSSIGRCIPCRQTSFHAAFDFHA